MVLTINNITNIYYILKLVSPSMLGLVGHWNQDVSIQNVGNENNKEEAPEKQLVQAQIASLINKTKFVHFV